MVGKSDNSGLIARRAVLASLAAACGSVVAGSSVFGTALTMVAALCFWSNVSRVTLFWAAFILTRPLGATVGDFLDKPRDHGGLALSRPLASAILAAFYTRMSS